MMNLALFASQQVGYEVAQFLGKEQEPISCLVVDARESSENVSRIFRSSRIHSDNVLTSDDLSADSTIYRLRHMQLDLILLAWWPYLLEPHLIRIPRLGCLNFHPSLLPYNRGKHYNFWTLVEDTPFGVTLHFINDGIDTGDIAYQIPIAKTWEDTAKTLYEKAQKEIVRLFIEKFPEIKSGRIPRRPQDAHFASFHRARELDPASQIDLDKTYTARALLNLLRARTFPPHPACFFFSEGCKYEVRVTIQRVEEGR